MPNFEIKGSPVQISKEELRAMLTASATVMEFHNHSLKDDKGIITVKVKPVKYLDGKTKTGENVIGRAFWKKRLIVLAGDHGLQKMFTLAIHEVIHLYKRFPSYTTEKCTSTLVNRLKPDVAQIYNSLVRDIYKRAAYIAHCKISYMTYEEDYYDKDENIEIELSEKGKKYRR